LTSQHRNWTLCVTSQRVDDLASLTGAVARDPVSVERDSMLIDFLNVCTQVYAEVMSEEDDGKPSILGCAVNRFSEILNLKKLHAKIADIEAKLNDMDADGDGIVISLFCLLLSLSRRLFSLSPSCPLELLPLLTPCPLSLALSARRIYMHVDIIMS
jgi:hypothetical protein